MSSHTLIELQSVDGLAEYPTHERLGEAVYLALYRACMNANGNPVRLIISTDALDEPIMFPSISPEGVELIRRAMERSRAAGVMSLPRVLRNEGIDFEEEIAARNADRAHENDLNYPGVMPQQNDNAYLFDFNFTIPAAPPPLVTDPEGFDDAAWEDMGPRPGYVMLELPL